MTITVFFLSHRILNWSFRWSADELSIDCGRRLMTTHRLKYSPVDIDSHKPSSWKVVHLCVLTWSQWWTTFQLLSLWLSMSTGLTSNDTCVVISEECGVTPQSIPEFPLRHSSKFNKIKIHTHTHTHTLFIYRLYLLYFYTLYFYNFTLFSINFIVTYL